MNVIEKSCLSPLPLRQARPDGPAVSAMGLGCMGLSEFYGASDDAGSAALLDAALQAGVRFFDTADVYGNGHNERLVGRHLRGHPARAEIKLATKGGILRDPDDPARRRQHARLPAGCGQPLARPPGYRDRPLLPAPSG